MKTLRTLKISPNAPDTNSVWLYKNNFRYFNNGAWINVGGTGVVNWDDIQNKPETFTPPIATLDTIGGIKQGPSVNKLAVDATMDRVILALNSIIATLEVSGLMKI